MPAYYLIYMEMYVLGTNKLKMHTTGVPTFKKKLFRVTLQVRHSLPNQPKKGGVGAGDIFTYNVS